MVPKDHTGLPAECGPLTMLPVFRMHFERLLKEEYSPRIQSAQRPAQAGFRPGDNALRQILVAEHIQYRSFRTLIDFRQAFDSPILTVLMNSVLEFGSPFARLIFSLYCLNTPSMDDDHYLKDVCKVYFKDHLSLPNFTYSSLMH